MTAGQLSHNTMVKMRYTTKLLLSIDNWRGHGISRQSFAGLNLEWL